MPEDARSDCPGCGRPLRFIDVPEADCQACGAAIPLPPGEDVVRCRCGHWQATDPQRAVRFMATCPRCRRRIEVPSDAGTHTCPHCRTAIAFHDTL